MALLNGKTSEELAHDIVSQAFENALIEIDGVRAQELEKLAAYSVRDNLKGQSWFEKNKQRLMSDVVEKMIADKFKAIEKYQIKREQDNKMQYFLLLRAKGMGVEEAEKESGIDQIAVK